jgi:predicted nucleic acid-binding protein
MGEVEAIVLAVEMKADLLLIDERKGRIAADRLGVNFIGLLGVLIKAKHEGVISTVGAITDDFKAVAGFWNSDDPYRHVLRAAGVGAPSYGSAMSGGVV